MRAPGVSADEYRAEPQQDGRDGALQRFGCAEVRHACRDRARRSAVLNQGDQQRGEHSGLSRVRYPVQKPEIRHPGEVDRAQDVRA
jgi:hypothetical protein